MLVREQSVYSSVVLLQVQPKYRQRHGFKMRWMQNVGPSIDLSIYLSIIWAFVARRIA
jgi:hypothetical protein